MLREYVSLEGCELATRGLLKMPQKTSPYYPMNLTPRIRFTFHYGNLSRRNLEPLQLSWGTHPQLNQGLPNLVRSFTTRSLRDTSNRLGYTMHARGTSSWKHNAPKSNKLLEFQSDVSPRRAQTYATNAIARPHKVVKSFTPKSNQSN